MQGEIIMQYMLMPYRKLYRLIEGRSSRSEYWLFTLLVIIVAILAVVAVIAVAGASVMSLGQDLNPTDYGALLAGAGAGAVILIILFYIWALLTSVASLAVTIRRIHDLNFSGWFLVLYYVALFGALAINKYLYWLVVLAGIVVLCLPGTKGTNKYGSDPTVPEIETEAFA